MTRRWLIRCLFLLPMVLSVAGWGSSYVYSLSTSWFDGQYHKSMCTLSNWALEIYGGQILVTWDWASDERTWRFAVDRLVSDELAGMKAYLDDQGVGFLGFRKGRFTNAHGQWFVSVPFWAPTILSGLALTAVWRRTRSHRPTGAFPVEVKAVKEAA